MFTVTFLLLLPKTMARITSALSIILVMTTFITINAQGLRSDDRRHNAFAYFRRNRLDIILIQETHWTSELETKIKSEWNGDVFFSNGTNNSRGVAVLISSRLDYNVIRFGSDNEGRVILKYHIGSRRAHFKHCKYIRAEYRP